MRVSAQDIISEITAAMSILQKNEVIDQKLKAEVIRHLDRAIDLAGEYRKVGYMRRNNW